jgi:hypothetical protein
MSTSRTFVLVSVLFCFLFLVSCSGDGKQGGEKKGLFETSLRSPDPNGPLSTGTTVINGKSYTAYIQQANSRILHDLDITARGAFYMKICGITAEAGEQGAVKFDVIINENSEKSKSIFSNYVIPFENIEDLGLHINIVVEVTKFAGQAVDVTMRMVGEEGTTIAWTEPEFRPFPGQQKR